MISMEKEANFSKQLGNFPAVHILGQIYVFCLHRYVAVCQNYYIIESQDLPRN